MADSLAGVVLAAGAGTRLRPLTEVRPKALCPVANVPLVDLAVARLQAVTDSVAVNVHHGRQFMEAHLAGRVHLSVEPREALGTAGALGALRDWIGGRPVLITNADTWLPDGVAGLAEGWDGERIRLLVVHDPARGDFGPWRYVGAALMPWGDVRDLGPEPSGLYEVCWEAARAADRIEFVPYDGDAVPCDTPADYLRANLLASDGESVIGAGSVIEGRVERSVVWPNSVVRQVEVLDRAIRVGEQLTVFVR
jgi:N-acetyl-alpha-D-muramate 1-phosphate uridylyltransferase